MSTNKVAMITGAAQGMGQACAVLFIENGYQVWALDVNQDALNTLKNELGDNLHPAPCDITNSQQVADLVTRIVDTSGSVDVLVNNAGVGSIDTFTETPDEHWAKVIGVNLTGAFYCAREAAKAMQTGNGGSIINISSTAAYTGEGPSHYCAAKAGLVGLTRSMAKELAADKIRVNAVIPGPTNTPMMQDIPEEWMQQMIDAIPLGRIGEPKDVAQTVLFLASEQASFVTGQNYTVNGGMAFI